MTLRSYIKTLIGEDVPDSIEEAHRLGLIDKYESEHPESKVLRKDAAKILHLYMLKVLSLKDEEDISPASVLKDLYDCRVCVNHIAQVYLKGIMKAHEYPEGMKLFDSNMELSEAEALEAIKTLKG